MGWVGLGHECSNVGGWIDRKMGWVWLVYEKWTHDYVFGIWTFLLSNKRSLNTDKVHNLYEGIWRRVVVAVVVLLL